MPAAVGESKVECTDGPENHVDGQREGNKGRNPKDDAGSSPRTRRCTRRWLVAQKTYAAIDDVPLDVVVERIDQQRDAESIARSRDLLGLHAEGVDGPE